MAPRSSKDGDRSTEVGFEVQEIRDEFSAIESLQSRQSPDVLLITDNRVYQLWKTFILIWAVYSSCFTPLEFGFFRGLPRNLLFLDIVVQIAFVADIIVQFYLTRRDYHTYNTSIVFHYFGFILDSLSCLPWDLIYKLCGRKEVVRYLLWIRLCRVRKITNLFQKMEKDIHINYLFTRIVKLIVVEFYCTHTATCIFYYLATNLSQSKKGYQWIESLKLGEYNYQNFWEIDFWKCYLKSLYIAIVAMASVGYGDMHSVNIRELVFIMIFIGFDMILGAYLMYNMIVLILIGSKTELFMDKMKDLIKYMNMNGLIKNVLKQIKGHVRLHNESSYIEAYIPDIQVSTRAKSGGNNTRIKQFESYITLQIGRKELELAQRVNNVVSHGYLECLKRLIQAGADPKKTDYYGWSPLHIAASKGFEDITLFLLQEGVDINARDKNGTTPLLEAIKGKHDRLASLLFDKGAKLGLKDAGMQLCEAAVRGDSGFLKRVLSFGADPNSTNYNHHTPLHIAASEGFNLTAKVLLEAGASVFVVDRWGLTPLCNARSSFTKMLENARSEEMLKFPERTQAFRDKTQFRKCTVFPFHPLCSEDERRDGVMMFIPLTIEELIKSAEEHFKCSWKYVLSEDNCTISDVAVIFDRDRVYMI